MFLISFVQLSAIGKLWNLVPTFYIKNDYQHVLYIWILKKSASKKIMKYISFYEIFSEVFEFQNS